jgi:hypothetical protein
VVKGVYIRLDNADSGALVRISQPGKFPPITVQLTRQNVDSLVDMLTNCLFLNLDFLFSSAVTNHGDPRALYECLNTVLQACANGEPFLLFALGKQRVPGIDISMEEAKTSTFPAPRLPLNTSPCPLPPIHPSSYSYSYVVVDYITGKSSIKSTETYYTSQYKEVAQLKLPPPCRGLHLPPINAVELPGSSYHVFMIYRPLHKLVNDVEDALNSVAASPSTPKALTYCCFTVLELVMHYVTLLMRMSNRDPELNVFYEHVRSALQNCRLAAANHAHLPLDKPLPKQDMFFFHAIDQVSNLQIHSPKHTPRSLHLLIMQAIINLHTVRSMRCAPGGASAFPIRNTLDMAVDSAKRLFVFTLVHKENPEHQVMSLLRAMKKVQPDRMLALCSKILPRSWEFLAALYRFGICHGFPFELHMYREKFSCVIHKRIFSALLMYLYPRASSWPQREAHLLQKADEAHRRSQWVILCRFCGTIGRFRCGRCREARYCCHACQRMDWPQHKTECVPYPYPEPVTPMSPHTRQVLRAYTATRQAIPPPSAPAPSARDVKIDVKTDSKTDVRTSAPASGPVAASSSAASTSAPIPSSDVGNCAFCEITPARAAMACVSCHTRYYCDPWCRYYDWEKSHSLLCPRVQHAAVPSDASDDAFSLLDLRTLTLVLYLLARLLALSTIKTVFTFLRGFHEPCLGTNKRLFDPVSNRYVLE